jgi:hypothetical protein
MTASEMLKLLKYGCWLADTSDAFNHRNRGSWGME